MYIVAGGAGGGSLLASTETLEKEEAGLDWAWQEVASLPLGRTVRGLGLDNGWFMVTGECWRMLCYTARVIILTS